MSPYQPPIDAAQARAHADAIARGDEAYVDPATGYLVLTAETLPRPRCVLRQRMPALPLFRIRTARRGARVRIVSLLPSATEIVYALGLGADLCGVSFECDFPAAARALPHVSGTALAIDAGLTPAQIDAAVVATVQAGASLYTLDHELMRDIDPELILAQDLCRVCAVPAGAVAAALAVIGCSAAVVALDPHTLAGVIECIATVGAATGTVARAEQLMTQLRERVAAVEARVAGAPRPRVLVLEWADPPFSAGHWVPEMIAAAGGEPVLADAGERSRRLEWSDIDAAGADVVLFMPCGFDLGAAVDQARPLLDRAELRGADRFFAVDANAYFSRPGPRVVDGVELLAAMLHPAPDRDRHWCRTELGASALTTAQASATPGDTDARSHACASNS